MINCPTLITIQLEVGCNQSQRFMFWVSKTRTPEESLLKIKQLVSISVVNIQQLCTPWIDEIAN